MDKNENFIKTAGQRLRGAEEEEVALQLYYEHMRNAYHIMAEGVWYKLTRDKHFANAQFVEVSKIKEQKFRLNEIVCLCFLLHAYKEHQTNKNLPFLLFDYIKKENLILKETQQKLF